MSRGYPCGFIAIWLALVRPWKRWWLWTFLPFLAILFGYLLLPVSGPRISQANFDKIELGWSSDQVRDLLGEDYSIQPTPNFAIWLVFEWEDEDNNLIWVRFHRVRQVAETGFAPSSLSLFERSKRRIERRSRALWP
jgi:hypothetical protein